MAWAQSPGTIQETARRANSTTIGSELAGGPPGHYFLVIDHSGSMLKPLTKGTAAGRSRWDLMRERAAGFVDRLPSGAEAWAVVFSAPDPDAQQREWLRVLSAKLDTPTNREQLTSALRSYPEPGSANGTWLYQAIDKALEQAEVAGARNPEAFLTVMVYTDGIDQGHGRTRSEMLRNGGSKTTRDEVEQRVNLLRQRHRNFNFINIYQPGDESIRDAHVVRLVTNRLQLASPAIMERQEAVLELAFRDSDAVRLEGRPLQLKLESADGTALPLRITGGPFKMRSGKQSFAVERTGEWPAGKDVKARIRLAYPALNDSFLVAEGGETVEVLIQGAEAPSIRELLPASGSVFPVGREITFSLTTLPDAQVDWDFGDGRSAQGNPVRHTFTEPAKRRVTVKVTDPRTQLTGTAHLSLEAVGLVIRLDPPPAALLPEKPVILAATANGDFERFEWNIDGQLFAGTRRIGEQSGTTLEYRFPRPGQVRVSVAGEGRRGGRVETETVVLTVKEVPLLRLTSPAAGQTLYFGSTREMRAEIEGVSVERVRFSLLTPDGTQLLAPEEVDVTRQGNLRQAVTQMRIPDLQGRVQAVLRVEALDAEAQLVRDASLTLEREPTTLEVMLPEGREPYVSRPTALRLQSNAALRDVRWDFGEGDGLVPGNEVERHTWKRYGDFTVRAVARDPDGQEVESAPVAIKVPVRPVTASAQVLLEGRAVGQDLDRVPLNATVQLQSQTTGDVRTVRWYLDGTELPTGLQTTTINDRGERRLRLVAEGTPEAGSAEVTITFRTSDPWTFWGGMAVLLFALGLLTRLLWGNKWRLAEFKVLTDGEAWNAGASPEPDAESRFLGRGTEARLCGRWNPWTKTAKLSVPSLDNRLEIRARQTEYENFAVPWKSEALLLFHGADPKPEPIGGLRVLNAIVQSRGGAKSMDTGRANSWVRCWSVTRPGVPSRRPGNTASNEPSFATMLLFMRLRKAHWLQRYWPDALLALVWFAAIGVARHLHAMYF